VILGASSFAAPPGNLKEHVESIELYIPKLGIYNGSTLEMKKLDRVLDEISIYDFATTVHAPYSAVDSKYPSALQVDTSQMSEREFTLLEESIALANRVGASVVVLHPGRVGPDREKSFSGMVKNLGKSGRFIGYVEEYASIGLSETNYQNCIDAFRELGQYR
jgi:sugar phosphate isomerase/epimerase